MNKNMMSLQGKDNRKSVFLTDVIAMELICVFLSHVHQKFLVDCRDIYSHGIPMTKVTQNNTGMHNTEK